MISELGMRLFLLRHVYVMVIFNIMISLLTIRMYKKKNPNEAMSQVSPISELNCTKAILV